MPDTVFMKYFIVISFKLDPSGIVPNVLDSDVVVTDLNPNRTISNDYVRTDTLDKDKNPDKNPDMGK